MTASSGFFAARKEMFEMGLQTCTVCGTTKPIDEFVVSRAASSGRKAACKICDRARGRYMQCRYRSRRAEKARRWRSLPHKALHHRISAGVLRGIRTGGKMGKAAFDLLGFTRDELMANLERQFVKGMTWRNMGEWHIDHVVPKSSFEFTTAEDANFKRCWALTNLRPLWSEKNLSKGSKVEFLL